MLTVQDLISEQALAERGRWVGDIIRRCLATSSGRITFFGRYAQWNGLFGSGVASLSGKIGRAQHLFLDPAEPIEALADRSVLVASFIFDAARDEFNDHNTKHRDTHRCLAQATLRGLLTLEAQDDAALADPQAINRLLPRQEWLDTLCRNVAIGYGNEQADNAQGIFWAMGYHLGSELLADQEFSVIDATLRNEFSSLYERLKATSVAIGPQEHNAYAWISIHSGYGDGGGAEAEHFEWATRGIRLALELTPTEDREVAMAALRGGFNNFAEDHMRFFTEIQDAAS